MRYSMSKLLDLESIQQQLREFAEKRDWQKFHNPKNLAMALSVEAAELVEIFQWLTEAESANVATDTKLKQDAAHELADILLYAIRLADTLKIDLTTAINEKIQINHRNYPIDLVKVITKKPIK